MVCFTYPCKKTIEREPVICSHLELFLGVEDAQNWKAHCNMLLEVVAEVLLLQKNSTVLCADNSLLTRLYYMV
jgi:hypothetical protein